MVYYTGVNGGRDSHERYTEYSAHRAGQTLSTGTVRLTIQQYGQDITIHWRNEEGIDA